MITMDFAMFYLIGCVGMMMHWAKKWARSETAATLYEYMFVNNAKRSVLTAISYTFAVVAMWQYGLDLTSPEAVMLALTTGYTIDSSINNAGERP